MPLFPLLSPWTEHAVCRLTSCLTSTLLTMPLFPLWSPWTEHAVCRLTSCLTSTLLTMPLFPLWSPWTEHAVCRLTSRLTSTLLAMPLFSLWSPWTENAGLVFLHPHCSPCPSFWSPWTEHAVSRLTSYLTPTQLNMPRPLSPQVEQVSELRFWWCLVKWFSGTSCGQIWTLLLEMVLWGLGGGWEASSMWPLVASVPVLHSRFCCCSCCVLSALKEMSEKKTVQQRAKHADGPMQQHSQKTCSNKYLVVLWFYCALGDWILGDFFHERVGGEGVLVVHPKLWNKCIHKNKRKYW